MPALAVALAAWLEPADDPTDRASIEWVAPPSCPSAQEVDALTERLLLAADGRIGATARVDVRADGRFALTLTIDESTEAFAADDCDSLARLTALLVAVAADPLAVARATTAPIVPAPLPPPAISPADPSPTPMPGPRVAPELTETVRPISTSPPRVRASGRIGVHGIVGVAELPTLDAGVGIAAAIELGRFAAELHASWLAPRTAGIPGFARAEAVLTAVNASVRGCGMLGRNRIRIALCAGPELGAVVARATNVRDSQPDTELWAALLASPALHWWVHRRVDLYVGADLLLALRSPKFALRDDTARTVDTGRGGLRAWAGVAVRFGGPSRGP